MMASKEQPAAWLQRASGSWVVVSYTGDGDCTHGTAVRCTGALQAAAGVPLRCDRQAGFWTFRAGLYRLG